MIGEARRSRGDSWISASKGNQSGFTYVLRILIIMILIGVIYFGYLYLSNIADNIEKQPETHTYPDKMCSTIKPQMIYQKIVDNSSQINLHR